MVREFVAATLSASGIFAYTRNPSVLRIMGDVSDAENVLHHA